MPDRNATVGVSVPSITFAIPYYSGLQYLGRAIKSVLAQRDPSWQAIVCDDSEDPAVEAFVREVGEGRVRYSRNPSNIGMARNFNRCIDVADTDLVTILHNDDELLPTYCGMMRDAAARHPDAAALFCRIEVIGPDSEPAFSLAHYIKGLLDPARRQEAVLAGEPGARALLKGNFIPAATLCFRKSVLRDLRFAERYKFVLDWDLTMSILLHGKSMVGLPERGLRNRAHDEAATEKLSRTQLRFDEEWTFYDEMQREVAERGWDKCAELAKQRRMSKLHMIYRALKGFTRLDVEDARRAIKLIRRL